VNAGFNTMSRVHRIDEFIFDCSFDSLPLANEHEPEMTAFLTAELLPAIDSILDAFDETDAVWRLDRVEIDLGDISGADFYAGLIQRVQEELSDQLRAMQSNFAQSGSMPIKTLPAQLPVQRLSKVQTDLEELQDFLLTGRMPWPMDTADRHAHEKMLWQILRESSASAAWVHLLKHLPVVERAVVINRLVSQFPRHALDDVLSRITPDHAHPLLDFLRLYQRAISDTDAMPAAQTRAVNAAWEKLLAMLLQPGQPADGWVTLLDRLVRKIAPPQARESLSLLKRIRQFAVQSRKAGKTGSLLYDALLTIENAYARNLHADATENSALLDDQDAARNQTKGVENERGEAEKQYPEIIAQPAEVKQTRPVHEALYSRIVAALQRARLIDAGFASILLRLQAAERRQRLQRLLQSPQIKPQLLQLPQPILLDISYWLSPPAALLIERLLAHSAALYRLPGSLPKTTQKDWKQQLWGASLDYLLSGTATEIDPVVYLQALVRTVSPEEADLQTTLRVWHAALEHSETGGAIATILRTLIGGAPAWQSAVEETPHSVQALNPESAANAAYRQLRQRFTTGYPAPLDAFELHSLIEQLLHMESASDTTDRFTFLQAIEKHADRVNDRQAYYRLLLEELLQNREIDLEAIAAQSQKIPSALGNAREDWNTQTKQAETESATGSTPQHATKQHLPAGDAALYATVIAALREAQLIDAHHVTVETGIQPVELRQRLRMTLRTIAVPGWVNKLPQSIRMDIAYLLSPPVALLIECLLAHSAGLYRLSGSPPKTTQKHWKQQLWGASLDYLLSGTATEADPAAYLQALVRAVSPEEAGLQTTLRVWHAALEQSETGSAIATILRTLIGGAPSRQQTVEEAPHSVQALNPESAANAAYRQLQQRFATGHPAPLDAIELHSLIEQLLQLESASDATDRHTFLQAIERHADQVNDRQAYYRLLLEELLQDREIDLEAIAAQSQQTPSQPSNAREDWSEQDKQVESESVIGSTPQHATKQHSPAGDAALYVTVLAALRKARLIDAQRAAMETGIQPAELRQRLRMTLRTIAVPDWVDKLPQSIRMDIAYLLAPQAAVLNEHLLAQTDKLYRVSGLSGQSNRQQWQQRLWVASLRYLLTLDSAEITPAAYLQALVRDVSDEADAQITLRAWHEALAQSKTSGTLHTLLRDLTASAQAKGRTDVAHREPAKPQAVSETENVEEIRLPQIAAQPAEAKQIQPVHDALYSRIVAVLQQAKLIDADFASILLRLQAAERRQRLQRLLQSPQIKPQLFQLPQPILLDISYWLSPPAALLIERLLAHSAALYRLSGSLPKTTQKHWKQRLWDVSLDYLLSGTATEIDPAAYLQALVRAVSPEEADLQTTLRAWHAALEQSESGGAIATLLRTLIGGASSRQSAVEETPHSVQKLNPESAANAAYRQLRQRFAIDHPAPLDAFELYSLIEQLLHMESASDTTDRFTFLQAIEKHADRVNDRQAYYRLLLEELLQDREIDLEAIAAQSQQTLSQPSNAREDWNKQDKQVESESGARSILQSTKKHFPAGDAALYATVIAALREARLIDAHHVTVETGTQPVELRQRLRMTLRTIAVPDWVNKLPRSVRMDIAYLLAPQAAVLNEHLLAQADKLYRVTEQSNRQQWQQHLWAASLRYLLTLETAEITPAAYLQALARGVSDETDAQITLRAWYEALAGNKTAAAIRLLLQALIETPADSPHSGMENPLVKTGVNPPLPLEQAAAIDWDALLNRTESTGVTEEIYIDNAGQVLAAPYLPRLFSMLKLVGEGAFVDRQAAERAVHLLQFMVNEQTQSPEFQLILNKILCGVSTGIPICREIDISAQEQETIEGLIRGMIQNWTTIGNTSISGLRETFLRRKGKLQLKEDGMWYLTVEPGVFDMLLDSLPWSFSVIKHSWMERAVHVTWR